MKKSVYSTTALWLLAASYGALIAATDPPRYVKARTIEPSVEWRFRPLVIDLDRDGHLDLVATARLAANALRIWRGDGKGNLTPVPPAWTDTGYGALAAGDINGDRFPDLVSATHFGPVQTLLSNGKGGFTEKVLRPEDGWTGAALGDVNGDRVLDLVLVGYQKAGIEIRHGDGTGNWTLQRTLPEPKPGQTMPGRAVLLEDLDRDGDLDLVAAFQRWGLYLYYGDGRGGFTGGPVTFRQPAHTPEWLELGDVNDDGHPDLAVNGNSPDRGQANGPDVYLGDGHGAWRASSGGLKVLRLANAGIALADLDRDGYLDIVAGGSRTGDMREGFGLFWFKGDGKGGWSLVEDSGLPSRGLSLVHGVAAADLDRDGTLEIVVLSGGSAGSLTIWKRQQA